MTTFHPFPSLPPELRAIIWELGIDAREVILQQRPIDRINTEHGTYLRSPTPIPGSLQACRESSSQLAYRHYSRAFGNSTSPHCVWVNFAVDTIRIDETDLQGLFTLTSHLAIRRLTVDCPAQSIGVDPDFEEYKNSLRAMPALERLSIVCNMPSTSRSAGNRAVKWQLLISGIEEPTGPERHPESRHCTMRYTDTGDIQTGELGAVMLRGAAAAINQELEEQRRQICVNFGRPPSGVRYNQASLLRAARMQ